MTSTSSAHFDADIHRALQPIAGEHRAGVPLRYAAVYREIRQARHEDDPTVPQGEWERPLKKADWPQVARLCLAALQSESKDLQIAAWLCEAWTRLHDLRGMAAGGRLLDGMVAHFWPDAYPPHEEDGEARFALFEWLRETLLVAMTMHVPLLEFEDFGEPPLNLDDWQRLVAGKPAAAGRERPDLATLLARVTGARLEGLVALRDEIAAAGECWALFARRLDQALGDDGPSLSALSDRLAMLGRAVDSLLDGRAPAADAPGDAPGDDSDGDDGGDDSGGDGGGSDASPPRGGTRDTAHDRVSSARRGIGSREEAYALLATVAAYLREHEPHSPTPYLIERALTWGRMPLRELMDEVLSEEGGMRWYAAMLGLDVNRE